MSKGPDGKRTFSVALPLNDRAHEDLNGPDIAERNLSLFREQNIRFNHLRTKEIIPTLPVVW